MAWLHREQNFGAADSIKVAFLTQGGTFGTPSFDKLANFVTSHLIPGRLSQIQMIQIDFMSDLTKIFRRELQSLGDSDCQEEDLNWLVHKWINFHFRQLPRQKWTVAISDSLKDMTLSDSIRTGFEAVIKKATGGEDLNVHLSKRSTMVNARDDLLNDWGFTHLHLGVELEVDGFIKRTTEVLFVYPKREHFYCIDILNHDFTNPKLLETVHRNWPEALKQFRVGGLIPPEDRLTKEAVKLARKKGFNTMMTMDDGTIYIPPGGGLSTAKTNINHTRHSDHFLMRVKEAENTIRKNELSIRKQIRRSSGQQPKLMSFVIAEIREFELDIFESNVGFNFTIKY